MAVSLPQVRTCMRASSRIWSCSRTKPCLSPPGLRSLAPANKVGVVDCDYRGEVCVALLNHSDEPQTVAVGERVAQLVITPYITAEFIQKAELSDTVRGEGGFGSTDRF